jgi:hypothetical protein
MPRQRASLWCVTALISVSAVVSLSAGDVEITLKNGNPPEASTAEQLRGLLKRFDVAPWLFTTRVEIEARAVPHSHPVLTLNTRHLGQDELLLSTFIHEQLHWWLVAHQPQADAAVADLRARFPAIAVGGLDGADSERSSYEHLVVIYLEWQGDKALLGDRQAREVMDFWAQDHYRQLYTLVIASEGAVRDVVAAHGLTCCAQPTKNK